MESKAGGKQEFDEEFSDKQFCEQAFSIIAYEEHDNSWREKNYL